jgi:heme exporter protein D
MIELGKHAPFIIASYLAVALVVAGLIAWVVADGRRLAHTLARLEAQGIRRRSERAKSETAHEPGRAP